MKTQWLLFWRDYTLNKTYLWTLHYNFCQVCSARRHYILHKIIPLNPMTEFCIAQYVVLHWFNHLIAIQCLPFKTLVLAFICINLPSVMVEAHLGFIRHAGSLLRAKWVRMLREKVIQTERRRKKRGGGQLLGKICHKSSLSTIPRCWNAAERAWWSAGKLHTTSVGVRAEGQGGSCCQRKVKTTTEYWFRHADICAYSMCCMYCRRLTYDSDEGANVL